MADYDQQRRGARSNAPDRSGRSGRLDEGGHSNPAEVADAGSRTQLSTEAVVAARRRSTGPEEGAPGGPPPAPQPRQTHHTPTRTIHPEASGGLGSGPYAGPAGGHAHDPSQAQSQSQQQQSQPHAQGQGQPGQGGMIAAQVDPPQQVPEYARPSDDLVGVILNERYRLLGKLGQGGMGSVYLAEHTLIQKKFAVKVLGNEFAHKPDLVERFLQEARAASMIQQENVVEITDYGNAPGGTVFFVMEHLEGEDLSRTLKSCGALDWARAKPILLQICRALQAAHEVGIIHRDMKPENCFRSARGRNPDFIKVLDFGIAKVTGTDVDDVGKGLTRTGMIFGTPEYMSPEQAQGQRPDHRVDIYALGVIMYELLTGQVPFTGNSFMAILTKHMLEQPVPPHQVNPEANIHPEAEAIVLKALQKDPENRFADMNEMAYAIECIQSGETQFPGFSRPGIAGGASEVSVASGLPAGASATGGQVYMEVSQSGHLPPRPGTGESVVAPLPTSEMAQASTGGARVGSGSVLLGVGLGLAVVFGGVVTLGVTRPDLMPWTAPAAADSAAVAGQSQGQAEADANRLDAGAGEAQLNAGTPPTTVAALDEAQPVAEPEPEPVPETRVFKLTAPVEAEVFDAESGELLGRTNSVTGIELPASGGARKAIVKAEGYEEYSIELPDSAAGSFTDLDLPLVATPRVEPKPRKKAGSNTRRKKRASKSSTSRKAANKKSGSTDTSSTAAGQNTKKQADQASEGSKSSGSQRGESTPAKSDPPKVEPEKADDGDRRGGINSPDLKNPFKRRRRN